ncbi:MAG: hypothetical protein Q7U57_07350 [Methylovulum sp.]|nr:hypothetical protein [Methylovulum sp.]
MDIDQPLDDLPPIQAGQAIKSHRQLQLRLPTQQFINLEIEAAKRGITSYKLASAVLALYLAGKMKIIKDQTPAA